MRKSGTRQGRHSTAAHLYTPAKMTTQKVTRYNRKSNTETCGGHQGEAGSLGGSRGGSAPEVWAGRRRRPGPAQPARGTCRGGPPECASGSEAKQAQAKQANALASGPKPKAAANTGVAAHLPAVVQLKGVQHAVDGRDHDGACSSARRPGQPAVCHPHLRRPQLPWLPVPGRAKGGTREQRPRALPLAESSAHSPVRLSGMLVLHQQAASGEGGWVSQRGGGAPGRALGLLGAGARRRGQPSPGPLGYYSWDAMRKFAHKIPVNQSVMMSTATPVTKLDSAAGSGEGRWAEG